LKILIRTKRNLSRGCKQLRKISAVKFLIKPFFKMISPITSGISSLRIRKSSIWNNQLPGLMLRLMKCSQS